MGLGSGSGSGSGLGHGGGGRRHHGFGHEACVEPVVAQQVENSTGALGIRRVLPPLLARSHLLFLTPTAAVASGKHRRDHLVGARVRIRVRVRGRVRGRVRVRVRFRVRVRVRVWVSEAT